MNFVCNSCGARYKRWIGKCSACNEWNTIFEEFDDIKSVLSGSPNISTKKKFESQSINFIKLSEQRVDQITRINSGIGELDRVLGSGFVFGSVVLIGGEPGIGKSTLLLQLAGNLSKNENSVLYVSGEESASQIFMRSERIGISKENITIISSGSILDILFNIDKNKPSIMIIDSIQTVYLSTIDSNPGTVNQIRASTFELINYCKTHNIILIIVGHITKDGQLAGPKLLEHMVDVVVYFEGESDKELRILRCVKNRFGAVSETGIFTMKQSGLEEVPNPSALFMKKKQHGSGSIIFVTVEGTRPLITEIESLVAPSYLPSPRRNVVGWDNNRLSMIIAILQNRCKIVLHDRDIYLNIAGGFRTTDPAADLAVAISLVNARKNKGIKSDIVVLGEVALSGEIRSIPLLENRINEAIKLGYKNFIVPNCNASKKIQSQDGVVISEYSHICDIFYD